MILDKENMVSNDQVITVTAPSTDVLDLQGAGLGDMGPGEPLPLMIQATETFTAAGAATLVVTLRTVDNAAMASPSIVLTTQAIPVASLIAGYRFPINFIPHGLERYVDCNYTVATGPMTAGKLVASLVEAYQSNV